MAGVELATFFENLDQTEPARIPNDREHELCAVLFRAFFISG
jgi:hypothetical protein